MNHLSRTLAIVAAISLAAPVWAQTEAAPAEEQAPVASGVSVSERPAQGDAEPDGYLSSEHGSWQVRCMHATDGSDPCQMYQLVKDADGNSVADMLVLLPAEGEDVAAFIQISAPLASLLPAGIAVSVDGAAPKRLPYLWCTQRGCVTRAQMTAPELESLKKGKAFSAVMVPAVAPDKQVTASFSLDGFTAAFDALAATGAKN
ncbi:invasion associated locus B family protein [Albidovulum sp.]|uniref:invasion associated locus B family protein n=1 Tax=Albidovulum sp. TaxID=1872424 RepID=UPI001D3B96D5|nr:invasion associated locus B family protein [Paracoccaceae bacterium]HPE25301.1 invasion associated locus B family protein [Albidovulum sp.]MCB2133730.1 invasion associated locus B family protein [Paracoccaceae bacterium]MCB2137948.1 invasion associated locus B family protein [Paracoccaceae bacterium]MCB2142808.1 invasion associated locus B family protein [Paracoccaceae bacterium]